MAKQKKAIPSEEQRAGSILARAAKKLGIKVLLEPRWKVAGQIITKRGEKRYFLNKIFDLNTLGASAVSCDKDYAAFFLKKMGYPIPQGRAFYSDKWCKAIGSKDNRIAAAEYATKIGFPLIVKPNSGSLGKDVTRVLTTQELQAVLARIFKYDRIALVQKPVSGHDCRIVVLDDEIISAYERIPLFVTGDGISSIKKLLKVKQQYFISIGRDTSIDLKDPRIAQKLARATLTSDSVPAAGTRVPLLDNSNLSAGGEALDVTERIHPEWKKLAKKISRDMNLRVSGIDVMTAEPLSTPPKKYWILEVNDRPGLDHYATIGTAQKKIVEELYEKILLAMTR